MPWCWEASYKPSFHIRGVCTGVVLRGFISEVSVHGSCCEASYQRCLCTGRVARLHIRGVCARVVLRGFISEVSVHGSCCEASYQRFLYIRVVLRGFVFWFFEDISGQPPSNSLINSYSSVTKQRLAQRPIKHVTVLLACIAAFPDREWPWDR